jgi:multidrug efflux pump subunit AcrA (membrane-fusion protein)
MFARMLIEDGINDVLSIPTDYVKSYGQLDMVWLLKDGYLSRRFVRLGKTRKDHVEIISGIDAGDTLVMNAK